MRSNLRVPAHAILVDERESSHRSEWAKTLTPGWQKAAHGQFQHSGLGWSSGRDLVTMDGPTLSAIWWPAPDEGCADLSPEERGRRDELADFKKMNQVRARVDRVVKDSNRRGAKPWYRQFCKRPPSLKYLPAFNRRT